MGGLAAPTRELYNRLEGIFLSSRTQFCVKNSPTGIKFFPERGAKAELDRMCSMTIITRSRCKMRYQRIFTNIE